jgi:formylglycine-generating enzyme required for sulfatase activity
MRALNQTLVVFFLLAGIQAGGQTPMPGNASMVLIPGGEFMMGKDSQAGADFSPAHRERTDSFYMDHEVTNANTCNFARQQLQTS